MNPVIQGTETEIEYDHRIRAARRSNSEIFLIKKNCLYDRLVYHDTINDFYEIDRFPTHALGIMTTFFVHFFSKKSAAIFQKTGVL